ncbi:P-loop containing nucleoside triphosphate hydrolase protein [Suillus placidus]|uniref:P-loop containing nucleoside triphosphate hydrolase protein n=1 Tax=Suillus placidus TaxID=48579 RepID=A0A9P6ZI24_9AGAM|nr:P-loop containing nucleoside triphosphate hydrolase protein [Suillus placidus]
MAESTIWTIAPEMAKSTIWTTAPEMAKSTIWTTAPEMAESTIRIIPPEMAESVSDPTGSQLQVVENHSPSKSVGQTLRSRNIQSVTPKMALDTRTEHDTTLSSDTTGLERRLNGSTPRSHKTIIVFGETGVGKSSLINLMAGEEVANISPGMQRCTMHWQDYIISFGGDSYKVFDTMGLEEPLLGIKEYLEGVENAYRLIKALDHEGGIDLLLFCIRAGRDSPALQSNYRLFHEFLCEKKVPIFLVITGLERERRMEDWWDRNKRTFEKFRIRVAGHACITAASRLSGRHRVLYEESRITIRNVVKKFTADGQKPAWTGADNLFSSLMRLKLKALREWNLHVKKRNIATHLTKRCGISGEVAQQLVGMMKQTRSNS